MPQYKDLASVILDRVLERGRLIRLDGPSGRTKRLKLENHLPDGIERLRMWVKKRLRISGTHTWFLESERIAQNLESSPQGLARRASR